MHRREFITGCSVACVAVGATDVAGFVGGNVRGGAGRPVTGRAVFDALVGGRLRAYRGARFTDTLVLARVVDAPKSGRFDQFTLVFEGAYRPDLEEGTYSLVDATGASYDMHLQPAGDRSYRAAFCVIGSSQTT